MVAASRKNILLVEDEPATATVVKEHLELAGFSVQMEASGRAALGYAAEHGPDLVILDLRLPDIHGYEVCRQLRQLTHPWVVPILMLTGMDQPIDRLRGFAYGADAYLTKPFELTELLRTAAVLLGEMALS